MKRTILSVLGSLILTSFLAAVVQAEDDAPRWQSRTQVEDHATSLDRRVVELQREIRAARHAGDQDALAKAQKNLKDVQAERVESLRALGQLP